MFTINKTKKKQHCSKGPYKLTQQITTLCCVRLHGPKSLTGFKLYTQQVPTSANIVVVPCKRTQQVTTLLGVVGQQCCVRLHGPKSLTVFKLYAASANIVVVPCKRTQQVTTLYVGPNNVGCYWSTMLGPFAWALTCRVTTISVEGERGGRGEGRGGRGDWGVSAHSRWALICILTTACVLKFRTSVRNCI